MTTAEYIQNNKERFLNELFELLRIPSISADSAFKNDVRKAAEYIQNKLIQAGADKVELCETAGYPIVYGEKMIDPALPTVLVYGHYDVQPSAPDELWETPAFEPVIRKTAIHPEGAIFARGSCDDKGQVYMHVKAFEAMMERLEDLELSVIADERVGQKRVKVTLDEL
jgi:acetylornithine deacetylase/succinyl-diaminopimelate desuccinylase-like protein